MKEDTRKIIGWKSIAWWPFPAVNLANGDNSSDDKHRSEEAARAVCYKLERLGFGLDGEIFPVRTDVRPIYEEQPPARQEGETPRCDAEVTLRVIGREVVSAEFARTLERELSAKQAEVEEHQRRFDTFWNNSIRAKQMWREKTGKELQWPDQTDLLVWLVTELESLKAAQGWREISGSLPNVGEEVLGTCFIEGDWTFPVIGTYKGRKTQGEAIALETDDDDFHPCSHWMPLPTPPVERSGE